ncbi:hypothetical protein CDAR_551051 [Caerostris darwini]|uniref:Uncharacterized protein n=1 Tax=Caerostris darwini TaxID=1538125 RepID=A0AAV4TXA1_9ARAC|nr:hypothetical protein CDAR_551051 [Caerostris darwini]
MGCELISIDGTMEGSSVESGQDLIQSHKRRNGRTVAEKQFAMPSRQPMTCSLLDDTNHRQQSKISILMIMDYSFVFLLPNEMGSRFPVLIKEFRIRRRVYFTIIICKVA